MATITMELSDSEKLLFENIKNLNVGEVIRLLNEEGTRVDCLDDSGMTSLQHAAYRGHVELCQVLLDRGANVNSSHHENGYTALMFAALAGSRDVVSMLLSAGASTTAVNSVKRNAAQMAAFVGNHAIVTLINNFVSRESIEYYTKIQGLESEPRLQSWLVAPLHRLLLQRNIHPVGVANFLRESQALLRQATQISKVLELMRNREMKRAEVNEVLALKFHFFAFVVRQCDAQVKERVPKKSHCTRAELLDDVIKQWLKPRAADGFQENLEKLVRQSIREFPFVHSPLLQQLVRNLAPVKIGDEPTALGLLTSTICGQRFGGDEEERLCAACGNEGATKRCSACKAAKYCDGRCQKLHWAAHKIECPRMAKEYEEEMRRVEEEAAAAVLNGTTADVPQASGSTSETTADAPPVIDTTADSPQDIGASDVSRHSETVADTQQDSGTTDEPQPSGTTTETATDAPPVIGTTADSLQYIGETDVLRHSGTAADTQQDSGTTADLPQDGGTTADMPKDIVVTDEPQPSGTTEETATDAPPVIGTTADIPQDNGATGVPRHSGPTDDLKSSGTTTDLPPDSGTAADMPRDNGETDVPQVMEATADMSQMNEGKGVGEDQRERESSGELQADQSPEE